MIVHLSDEVLSAHLDGALDGAGQRQVADHLRNCVACTHRLELLAATARAISELPDEQPPAPLDLSFLPPRVATGPRVLPVPARWRPPAWAAPVLAAAAILLVAVTLGPGLLRGGPPTATSSQAGSSSDGNALAPRAGSPSGLPGGLPDLGPTAGGAVPKSGSLPFATTSGAGAAQSFPQSGGASVALSAGQKSPRAGQPLTLNLVVHAGSTPLQPQRSFISVSRDSASQEVTAAGGETILPGQASSLSGTWDAGKLGSAPEATGDYQVDGHVVLSDGSDLHVGFTIHVG